jgi:FixJ family two-component response regulator
MENAQNRLESAVVHIVDDDEGLRSSLALLIESVGYRALAFGSATDFLERYHPDEHQGCLILDIRMPGMSGLDLQDELNRRGVVLPVIFITGHGDVPMAVGAMKNGAFDFIQKPFRDQQLLDCVNRALQADADMRRALLRKDELLRRIGSLTPREREVMQLIVDGRANKVIAMDLKLSERTVEIHRARVMEKMGVRSVAQLVKMTLAAESTPRAGATR